MDQVLVEASQPEKTCDFSVICPNCELPMDDEHAHMRCPSCGYRDSCCF